MWASPGIISARLKTNKDICRQRKTVGAVSNVSTCFQTVSWTCFLFCKATKWKNMLGLGWVNPTYLWDWQLLCHQQLVSLDADGGRMGISNSRESDGFATRGGLTLANLDMRLKRSGDHTSSTLYILHALGQWLHITDSYIKVYAWWSIWGSLFDLRE